MPTSRPSRSSSISRRRAAALGERVRDHFERHPHADPWPPASQSPRCCAARRRAWLSRRALLSAGRHAEVRDEVTETGCCAATASAASASATAALRRLSSTTHSRTGRPSARCAALDDRRVDRVQRQPRVDSHSASCATASVVVIVEVRARREELDRLEAVRGDVDQVVAAEPVVVEEVRGDAEALITHGQCWPACEGPVAHSNLGVIAIRRRARRADLAQAREARVALEVGAHVAERARDVLDVDRVAARRRLVAERAERLEVALQRHQVEAAAEFARVLRATARRRLQRQEDTRSARRPARSARSTYESRSSDTRS